MLEQWSPTGVGLVITIIGVTIEKIISSYFTGRKLAMIEAHVNSKDTAYTAKIQSLENESKLLREQASENTRIAAVLAQAQTHILSQVRQQIPVQAAPTGETKVLEDIKDNTEDTVHAVKQLHKEKK